jgi:predicted nicotinamide N-methyase
MARRRLVGNCVTSRDMAARVTAWPAALHRRDARVFLGDRGRSYLARDKLVAIATYKVRVTHSLEDAEIKNTSVWTFR